MFTVLKLQGLEWYFYLKLYWRCVLDKIILETNLEVKVTVVQIWFPALCRPKMHPHTKGVRALRGYFAPPPPPVRQKLKSFFTSLFLLVS